MQICAPGQRLAGPVRAPSGQRGLRARSIKLVTKRPASSDDDFGGLPSFPSIDMPVVHDIEALRQQVAELTHALQARQISERSASVGPSSTYAANHDYPYTTFSNPFKRKLSKMDYDGLPHRIILIRHAESVGNVEKNTYCTQPDHTVPLTDHGRTHALHTGRNLRNMLDSAHGGPDYRMFFMTSPYVRTLETTDMLLDAFTDQQVVGVRQAVQLREQDFGNFQDPARINQDMSDRQKFGRFWFRFPNGESGADVYDRLTIFEDHLTRDMLMGRFADTSLVLVSHGLTIRIFLMRWFHWGVDEFMEVYNPDNCEPVILEKLPWSEVQELQGKKYAHAKHCYVITPASKATLRGCADDMCSYLPRKNEVRPKQKWMASRARAAAQRANSQANAPFSGTAQSMTYSEDELTAMQLAANMAAAHQATNTAAAAVAAATEAAASANAAAGHAAAQAIIAHTGTLSPARTPHDKFNEVGCISCVD